MVVTAKEAELWWNEGVGVADVEADKGLSSAAPGASQGRRPGRQS